VDILLKACIRFTQPSVFNDPFEMSPVFTGAATAAELGSTHEMIDLAQREFETLSDEDRSRISFSEFMEAFVEQFNRALLDQGAIEELISDLLPRFNSTTGVLSLAEKSENLLMWSHYADQHRGFVVEFDADHAFFDQRREEQDQFHRVCKVLYSGDRPHTTIAGFLGPHSLLTKSAEWSYEQEWRMLVDLPDFPHQTLTHADDEIHLVALPPTCITRILLGHRMPDEKRAEIADLVSKDRRYSHVTVLQAELDRQKFRLNFDSLANHYFERGKALVQRAARWGAREKVAKDKPRWEPLLDASLIDLAKAIQLAPNVKEGWMLRATVLLLLEREEQALEDFSRAILLDPKDALLHAMRGQIYVNLGQWGRAESDYQRAVRLGMPETQELLDAVRQAKVEEANQRTELLTATEVS
jgi:tetratricopeptide (TPR) repeat protein